MSDVEARREIVARLTADDGEFALGTATIRGVQYRVYKDAPNDLGGLFAQMGQFGSAKALTFEGESLTWAEADDATRRFAWVLTQQLGVSRGDRVALAMRNYPEWAIAFAATVSVGAVSVPLNSWWTGQEISYALNDCEAKVFVGDAQRVEGVVAARPGIPSLQAVIEVRPEGGVQGEHEWTALLAGAPSDLPPAAAEIDTDQDCTILYTSGTTGRPKGAVASHRAHISNMYNMRAWGAIEAGLATWRGEPPAAPPAHPPTSLLTGPLFHVGTLPNILAAAVGGTHIVLMHKWDPEKAVKLIDELQVTSTAGVPMIVRQLLEAAENMGSELPSLSVLFTGGAQSSSELIRRIGDQFHGHVGSGTGYGLTETTGPMVGIGSHDFFERPLAVGRPFPASEIRVVGPDGKDVPPGELGESWFRGPNVARGYWNLESEAFRADGWFRSGDLVTVDEHGFVYIVDRIKDVIIKAGENVYCAEVEEVLSAHPAVWDAAVFGIPHELWGEEVVGVVEVRPDATLDEEELRRYVRDRLAAFKIPTKLVVTQEPLPRNASGKILKRELRERQS